MQLKTLNSGIHVPTIVDRFLVRDSLVNNLSISVLKVCRENPSIFPVQRFYFVESAHEVVAYAHATPPYPLCLSVALPGALQFLGSSLAKLDLSLDALYGPTPATEAFLSAWPALAKRRTAKELQGLYRLKDVIFPKSTGAIFSVAEGGDLELAVSWHKAFCLEAKDPLHSDKILTDMYRDRIAKNDLFLLRSGNETLAMASATRELGAGRVLSFVYTPPAHRRKGYASELVAQSSAELLERGYEYCCLFAQIDKKTRRHLYEDVGYVFIMEFTLHRFSTSLPS